MSSSYRDEEGECDLIGEPINKRHDGKSFFTSIIVHNLTVKIGNNVRVVCRKESNDDYIDSKKIKKKKADDEQMSDGNSETEHYYGQVLAIYDDPEEGVMVEIRWYLTPEQYISEKQFATKSKKKR
jgi:hypothetical protein